MCERIEGEMFTFNIPFTFWLGLLQFKYFIQWGKWTFITLLATSFPSSSTTIWLNINFLTSDKIILYWAYSFCVIKCVRKKRIYYNLTAKRGYEEQVKLIVYKSKIVSINRLWQQTRYKICFRADFGASEEKQEAVSILSPWLRRRSNIEVIQIIWTKTYMTYWPNYCCQSTNPQSFN